MSPSSETLSVVLAPVLETLRNGLGDDLVAVVLFGSRARGEAGPESDWDLLVIAENLPDLPWQRQKRILALLPAKGNPPINLLAYTPAEWFALVTPLALDIALDGIVLYERSNAMLSARLMALRQQLFHLGLKRKRLAEGEWLWLWQDQPRHQWRLEWRQI